MRKSKYDQVLTTTPINEDNTNCSSFETQLELSTEMITLKEQIETVKLLTEELKRIGPLLENIIEANDKSRRGLNAAVQSSENIIDGICHAIKRVEKTPIPIVFSPKEISELAFHRKNLIDEEKKLMDSHMEKLRSLQESHLKEIQRHLKSESGFFLTGWVSKYSVIAFWVLYAYFCITIAIWISCRI